MEKFIIQANKSYISKEDEELRVYADYSKAHKYDRIGDAIKDAAHINSIMGKPVAKVISIYEQ